MNRWIEIIKEEKEKPYFKNIEKTIAKDSRDTQIYPPQNLVFNALTLTPFEKVKVVIIGQDPYHGPNQANGLSFSVKPGIAIPPSLRNIYKELITDIDGFSYPNNGDLTSWAEQGVLLLNTSLTVKKQSAGSHSNIGWEVFTDKLVESLNKEKEGLIFVLWGAHAQRKGVNIDTSKHFIIKSAHPSPFSAHRGFLGSKPFSKINEILKNKGLEEINWNIQNI